MGLLTNRFVAKVTVAGASLVFANVSLAHSGHEQVSSMMAGLSHPVGGLDHLLVMLGVGLWASLLGGRAIWAVPMAFVLAMILGGGIALMGVSVPFVEQGILLSMLMVGGLVFGAKRLPLLVCASLAGVFALFHGAAHGAEMPLSANGGLYALGFALATFALHLVGVLVGHGLMRIGWPLVTRLAGSGIALSGAVLALT